MMNETQISPTREAWLTDLAAAIVERGLAAPAVLLIEIMRPFGFLGSQMVLMLEPLGRDGANLWLQRVRRLLQEPQQMEALQHLLTGRVHRSPMDEGTPCKPLSR